MIIYRLRIFPYIIKLTSLGSYNVIHFKNIELHNFPTGFIFNATEEVERALYQWI